MDNAIILVRPSIYSGGASLTRGLHFRDQPMYDGALAVQNVDALQREYRWKYRSAWDVL